jgi:hypothetical protein
LGATNVGGNLSVTSGGAVSGGPLDVNGTTTINAGANAITLLGANDFTGSVSTTGGTTQINDVNALTLGNVNASALTVISNGALNLGTLNATTSLTANSNGGNITQSGAAVIAGATNLQAGAGSITLASGGNNFGGLITAGGTGGITLVDANDMNLGTINAGAGTVNLTAGGDLLDGPAVIDGSSGILSSSGGADLTVTGLDVTFTGGLTLTGSATLWSFEDGSSANPFGRTSTAIGVQVGPTIILANLVQVQAGNIAGSVSASAAAVIVDEANKTFGTDSVAEDVEYGFAGEIGATPPMDHRIDESGISLPSCVQESREGEPCKN